MAIKNAAALWIVAAVITVIYILSTLPTPLYVLYRQAFQFSQLTVTVIYAVYVVGTIVAMFLFGRLSDQIGRRPVVLVALAVGAIAGIFFFFVNKHSLAVSRANSERPRHRSRFNRGSRKNEARNFTYLKSAGNFRSVFQIPHANGMPTTSQ